MEPVNNINSFIIGMATAYYAIMSYKTEEGTGMDLSILDH